MARAAATAMYADLHEAAPYHDGSFQSWAKDRSSSHPYKYDDGVSIGVSETNFSPRDMFTTEVNARPA